jgi:hypothetical protein
VEKTHTDLTHQLEARAKELLASGLSPAEAEVTARGELYSEALKDMIALKDKLTAAGKTPPADLVQQIRDAQSKALFFASEAYLAEGTIRHVVFARQAACIGYTIDGMLGEVPKSVRDMISPDQARHSFLEQIGYMNEYLHGARDPKTGVIDAGKLAVKFAKYFVRGLDAARLAGVNFDTPEMRDLAVRTVILDAVRGSSTDFNDALSVFAKGRDAKAGAQAYVDDVIGAMRLLTHQIAGQQKGPATAATALSAEAGSAGNQPQPSASSSAPARAGKGQTERLVKVPFVVEAQAQPQADAQAPADNSGRGKTQKLDTIPFARDETGARLGPGATQRLKGVPGALEPAKPAAAFLGADGKSLPARGGAEKVLTPGDAARIAELMSQTGTAPSQGTIYVDVINAYAQAMIDGSFDWSKLAPPGEAIRFAANGAIDQGHHLLIAAVLASSATGRPVIGNAEAKPIVPPGVIDPNLGAGRPGKIPWEKLALVSGPRPVLASAAGADAQGKPSIDLGLVEQLLQMSAAENAARRGRLAARGPRDVFNDETGRPIRVRDSDYTKFKFEVKVGKKWSEWNPRAGENTPTKDLRLVVDPVRPPAGLPPDVTRSITDKLVGGPSESDQIVTPTDYGDGKPPTFNAGKINAARAALAREMVAVQELAKLDQVRKVYWGERAKGLARDLGAAADRGAKFADIVGEAPDGYYLAEGKGADLAKAMEQFRITAAFLAPSGRSVVRADIFVPLGTFEKLAGQWQIGSDGVLQRWTSQGWADAVVEGTTAKVYAREVNVTPEY